MEQQRLGTSGLNVSRIALGAMRYNPGKNGDEAEKGLYRALDAAQDAGINFIDHADIYAAGECERVFGRYLRERPGARDRWMIQTKVGIHFPKGPRSAGRYDFSREHILSSVDGCLERLGVDRVEVLLLHRPDALMQPEEVAAAFDDLEAAGKVRHFGVCNQSAAQIELLRTAVRQPLIANQLELSLQHPYLVADGMHVNRTGQQTHRCEGLLEFCRLHRITIQPWCPLGQRMLRENLSADSPPHFAEAAEAVETLANEKGVTSAAIHIAWLLAHPAKFQPIIGTTKAERVKEMTKAIEVSLSREEWYFLLEKATGTRAP